MGEMEEFLFLAGLLRRFNKQRKNLDTSMFGEFPWNLPEFLGASTSTLFHIFSINKNPKQPEHLKNKTG